MEPISIFLCLAALSSGFLSTTLNAEDISKNETIYSSVSAIADNESSDNQSSSENTESVCSATAEQK